jgi:alpha-tubulin suppressor-like RCC1 family protein
LTNSSGIYSWGSNEWGQLGDYSSKRQTTPMKPRQWDKNFVMISCGFWHSMGLTENGEVNSWGANKFGQLGSGNRKVSKQLLRVKIRCKNSKIVAFRKISCGLEHSLLLSLEEDIYAFGRNDFGQLGSEIQNDEMFPLEICSNNKFDDLISHPFFHISSALTFKGENLVWGKCNDEVIKEPKSTKFETFIEIFNYYFQ